MLKSTKLLDICAILALAVACGSSDDSDSGGPFGIGDFTPTTGGTVLSDGGGLVPVHTGGTRPLPEGGLEALREASCAGWSAAPEPMPSVLMLVVDVSNSMNDRAPGSRESKWVVTRDALQQAIDGLPGSIPLGVLYYPNQRTSEYFGPVPITECVNTEALIPIDLLGGPDSAHRQTVNQSMRQVVVAGGTPTYDAYTFALEELERTTFAGQRFMLLITDGQPTYGVSCIGTGRAEDARPEYITPIVEAIAEAHAAGMGTFVIGSPGSEESSEVGEDMRPWLSEAAEAGGTALDGCSHDGNPYYCHFDMVDEPDFGVGLTNALVEIAGQIVQCEYELPAPPAGEVLAPEAVNVVYTTGDGQQLLVLRNDAPDCAEGWRYSDDGQRVVLCEETCRQVKADADARLELMFGCATEAVPIR